MSNFVDEGHICIRAKSAYSINTVFDPAKQNRQVLMLRAMNHSPLLKSFATALARAAPKHLDY
jgi:hypothetical protein